LRSVNEASRLTEPGDGPEGRALLYRRGPPDRPLHLLTDRAYEGNETRQLAIDMGWIFSRFEKLDRMFVGFISFVPMADGLRLC
jgi:hypothetical protein